MADVQFRGKVNCCNNQWMSNVVCLCEEKKRWLMLKHQGDLSRALLHVYESLQNSLVDVNILSVPEVRADWQSSAHRIHCKNVIESHHIEVDFVNICTMHAIQIQNEAICGKKIPKLKWSTPKHTIVFDIYYRLIHPFIKIQIHRQKLLFNSSQDDCFGHRSLKRLEV